MYALVDCNNFYASCERLFKPKLANSPIIVLSNNDGCVIARSNEAKALGIKMAEPFFKIKHLIKKNNISVFSSNYAFYGDMSRRVMSTLQDSWPEMEIYSIDEAFLCLDKLSPAKLNDFSEDLQKKVSLHTGIPVSIGLGETKTLAKLANIIAKKELFVPVFMLTKTSHWLDKLFVSDIWGVGRKWAEKLKKINIKSVRDLQTANLDFLKKKFGITLARTALELRGIHCFGVNVPEPKKSIVSSKSFGTLQTGKRPIFAALSSYCERATEKLRSQKSLVGYIQVFLYSNSFRKDLPQYSNSIGFKLINPTSDVRKIVKCARYCLNAIFKEGYQYKKVGIMLSDLTIKEQLQFDLFSTQKDRELELSEQLMAVKDSINHRYGKRALMMASNANCYSWQARSHYASLSYTTRWEDLPFVR